MLYTQYLPVVRGFPRNITGVMMIYTPLVAYAAFEMP
jgi:hypothetical protein